MTSPGPTHDESFESWEQLENRNGHDSVGPFAVKDAETLHVGEDSIVQEDGVDDGTRKNRIDSCNIGTGWDPTTREDRPSMQTNILNFESFQETAGGTVIVLQRITGR
ncbi:hypothetical protein HDE_04259 [Halotydeus destructor]|nr:hypothetical protein HDE_04259 [Halotydeus destructor]